MRRTATGVPQIIEYPSLMRSSRALSGRFTAPRIGMPTASAASSAGSWRPIAVRALARATYGAFSTGVLTPDELARRKQPLPAVANAETSRNARVRDTIRLVTRRNLCARPNAHAQVCGRAHGMLCCRRRPMCAVASYRRLNRGAPPRLPRCRSSASASLHRTRAWRQRDRDR